MPGHVALLRLFLWISVFAWGIALGAKLFDLIVLAGAWSSAPPESLTLLPYGPQFRVNPGQFFMPVSLVALVGAAGALISGWTTPFEYRRWLWSPVLLLVAVWVITVPVMWPLNAALRSASHGATNASNAEVMRMAHRWIRVDWLRVAMIAAGFLSAIRAISLSVPP
jgi:hypothetical protein